ncbi:MAG: elongation factor G, partial [Chloroflexi bacterium]|nr:elongation factor G [Chloroflexota bacterium]
VDEGTTLMDWMDQERERGITITAAATTAPWKGYSINVIDTPGHVDFTAEVERSLRVLDGGVVVLDAVAGVQPQSETVWRQADKYKVPRICFVNKMDRQGASFSRAVQSIRDRLKARPVPIQIPIGSESSFRGIVDLFEGTAYTYTGDEPSDPVAGPLPDDLKETYRRYREAMVEVIAETDERLTTKFLEGHEIAIPDLKAALRRATIANKVVPVLCGTALRNKGVQLLLDAILAYLPSPFDIAAVEGTHPKTSQPVACPPDPGAPFAALAFKVMTDPFVGRLVFFRVYSGTISSGAGVYNTGRDQKERMGRILLMHANRREEIQQVAAGQIAAAVGLKNTFTGDTICDPNHPVVLESIKFPEPVLSMAIEPRSKADQDKLTDALIKLGEEDPTFQVTYNQETGQTIMAGMGELHLEVLAERMRREFKVDAVIGRPQVSYRETVLSLAKAEGRFIRQSGGRGQYGHVWLQVEPQERGKGFEFVNKITGGVVPREYIPGVEKGVKEAVQGGVLAGYPVVDVRVTLYDGSYHAVDSSEMAFHAAATIAFKEAARRAKVVLLEPIMLIGVITPGQYMGDVLGEINSRRARIQNIEGEADVQVIRAHIPLAEAFGYATALRSLTQGRATYTMEFHHYEEVPQAVTDQILGAKAAR